MKKKVLKILKIVNQRAHFRRLVTSFFDPLKKWSHHYKHCFELSHVYVDSSFWLAQREDQKSNRNLYPKADSLDVNGQKQEKA